MKVALRKGWITGLPDFSAPYKKQMKVILRPWFTPEEYKSLYTATREYVRPAKTGRLGTKPKNYTTTFCSWRTPVCVQTKPRTSNIAT